VQTLDASSETFSKAVYGALEERYTQ